MDFELNNPAGETVRLLAGEHRDLVLVEARLLIDRRSVEGYSLLRIEWLLIQDPREEISPRRQLLPGQKYPGLGLVRDAVSILILACEQLGLAGVIFAPSHYHIAVQTERLFEFLEARAEASFQKLQEALQGRSLREASVLVDSSRVMNLQTGKPYAWDPAPMILVLNDGLRGRLRGSDYQKQVERARREFSYQVPDEAPSQGPS